MNMKWLSTITLLAISIEATRGLYDPILTVEKTLYKETENIIMYCNISTSQSNDGYYWYKNNASLSSIVYDTHKLEIKSATRNDDGEYACATFNTKVSGFIISAPINIKVFFMGDVTIITGDNLVTATIGDGIYLDCQVYTYSKELALNYVWSKDGKVQKTTGNAMTLINVSKDDAGEYQCEVNGIYEYIIITKSTAISINVYWMEKPTLSVSRRFYVENEDIIFNCNVDSNPSNVFYYWHKNGEFRIGNAYKSNMVVIKAATRNDSGEYSCATYNTAVSRYKSSSSVNITVFFIGDVTITQVIAGNSSKLVCQVLSYSNNLALDYTWSKREEILESKQNVLLLNNVSNKKAEEYKCIVTGTYEYINITKSTAKSVIVYYKAIGLSFDTNQKETGISSNFTIKCSAQDYGEPRAVMSWKRNGTIQGSSVNGTELELSITNATFLDTDVYTCTASNIAGEISLNHEIIVIGPPNSPTELKATSKTSTSIKIQWQAPIFNGNKNVIGYKIRYKAQENTMDYTTNETNLLSFDINGLKAFLYYEIKVQAINSQGSSSDTTIIERTEEAVPNQPKMFAQQLPLLSKEIQLQWSPPNSAKGIISSYNICYTQLTSDRGLIILPPSESCRDVGNVTQYLLTNLEKYSSYKISVCATNGVGCGDKAELVDIYTRQEEPMTVSDLNVSLDAYNVSVTWNKPRNIYGVFQAYSISYKNEPSSPPITKNITDFTITSINITNLVPNNNYTIEIVVFNDMFKSKVLSGIYKTLGVAPPPIIELIVPLKDQIEKTRFVIKLKPFDQTKGIVQKYQIITFKLSSGNLPSKKPWEYTESEIERNIRGELTRVTEGQEFIIGGSEQSRRKRQTVSNVELSAETYYGVFVRGFIRLGVYGYTDWYPIVKTKSSDSVSNNDDDTNTDLIAAIVFLVVLLCIFLLGAFLIIKRKEKEKQSLRNKVITLRCNKTPAERLRSNTSSIVSKAVLYSAENSPTYFQPPFTILSAEKNHIPAESNSTQFQLRYTNLIAENNPFQSTDLTEPQYAEVQKDKTQEGDTSFTHHDDSDPNPTYEEIKKQEYYEVPCDITVPSES